MVRLTDHPDMTLDVYPERKTTIQQQIQIRRGKRDKLGIIFHMNPLKCMFMLRNKKNYL